MKDKYRHANKKRKPPNTNYKEVKTIKEEHQPTEEIKLSEEDRTTKEDQPVKEEKPSEEDRTTEEEKPSGY